MGKVSDDNAENGLIDLISNMTGLDPSKIILSDEMLSQIKQMVNEKAEIKRIISPFYDELNSQNTKDSKKKVNELIDLGKFIYYLQTETGIEIIECSEQPDFIIKYQNELIGIEHTGIYDDDIVAEIKTFKKIINKCQVKLNQGHSFKGLFNVMVVPSKLRGQLPFKINEIIESICSYVIAVQNETEIEKPDFIANIIKSQHPTLELTLGEEYWLKELSKQYIETSIFNKENKIETYKSLKNINKCWLLIVIDGASSASSFNIIVNKLPMHSTSFDQVYVFDNFKGQIIKGNKTLL